jgi:hypothetical protein
MKKRIAGIVLGLGIFGATAVYACMGCGGADMFGPTTDLEKVRIFQKETSLDRDEMMLKRIELTQEKAKAKPDKTRIAALNKEMIEIRSRLQESAKRLGLTGGCLTECNQDPADCIGNCTKQRAKSGKKAASSGCCDKCNKRK